VVAYEVFTGKTLPRHGLRRYWRNAMILAAGYGVVVGLILTIQLRPIYSLLLTALLMTVFYALLSWRSYADRERYMQSLRPFVVNQPGYVPMPEALGDAAVSFRALCREVLGARRAYLLAVGPLAPLVSPLVYPAEAAAPPALNNLLARFTSPRTMYLPLNPEDSGDASWAVPLWSERGLIGVLLLGEKSDGGLYMQEEIEIARASGERLIDTQASAELARRLLSLQRQRLAESQLLDHRARRVLHDEVLPSLHTALLMLNGPSTSSPEAIGVLSQVHRQISDLLRAMPPAASPASARLGLLTALRQTVDNELRGAFDDVIWQVAPEAEGRLPALPALTTDVLFYAAREALRNAARHARRPESPDPLRVRIEIHWQDELMIMIEDNGVGAKTQPAGDVRGQGLALHSAMLAVVGGELALEAAPGGGARVTLTLPSDNFPSPRTVV
jgi:signal transduction histidine kinase